MKKQILILLTALILISFVSAVENYNTYYQLNLDYDSGKINISSVGIEFFQEKQNSFGLYIAEINDYNNKILNLSFFGIPNEILVDNVDHKTGEISGGGLVKLDKVSFELYIPYYESAKEIIIYDENMTELARINVGDEYSKIREENAPAQINKTETGENKILENQIPILKPEEKDFLDKLKEYSNYWWVLVIVLVILLIILFFPFRKNK